MLERMCERAFVPGDQHVRESNARVRCALELEDMLPQLLLMMLGLVVVREFRECN